MIDYAKITIRAGNGGKGVTSFLREKYVPKGGPDGGDGGHGGNVIIRASTQLSTLLDFQYRRVFEAPHGEQGGSRNKHGKNGSDLVIEVPIGTIITVNRIEKEQLIKKPRNKDYDSKIDFKQIVLNYKKLAKIEKYKNYHKSRQDIEDSQGLREIIVEKNSGSDSDIHDSIDNQTYPDMEHIVTSPVEHDLSQQPSSASIRSMPNQQYKGDTSLYAEIPSYDLDHDGAEIVIARGGKGGRGNDHFKSPSHQVPLESERGQRGEVVEIELQLKMIAHIGLVGFPNAGKSTLLKAMTSASPKIGNYPFTTIDPNLGVLKEGVETLVLADLPGLIEGAHEGKGLGIQFLKHIERTALLIHLIGLPESPESFTPTEVAEECVRMYQAIRNELQLYGNQVDQKPELLVINKVDLLPDSHRVESIKAIDSAFRSLKLDPIFISAQNNLGLNGLKQVLYSHTQIK